MLTYRDDSGQRVTKLTIAVESQAIGSVSRDTLHLISRVLLYTRLCPHETVFLLPTAV